MICSNELEVAITTLNYSDIVNYRDELKQLNCTTQFELFEILFQTKTLDVQSIKKLVLIIDCYCPEIESMLLEFAIRTDNVLLFTTLYQDFDVLRKEIDEFIKVCLSMNKSDFYEMVYNY